MRMLEGVVLDVQAVTEITDVRHYSLSLGQRTYLHLYL